MKLEYTGIERPILKNLQTTINSIVHKELRQKSINYFTEEAPIDKKFHFRKYIAGNRAFTNRIDLLVLLEKLQLIRQYPNILKLDYYDQTNKARKL